MAIYNAFCDRVPVYLMAGNLDMMIIQPNAKEGVTSGKLRALPLGPETMIRRLGLIYRKDKALSKAALGFIQVILENFGAPAIEISKAPRVAVR